MKALHRSHLGWLLGVSVMLAGCSLYPVPDRSGPPVAVPSAFSAKGVGAAPERWWEDFKDPVLDRLMEQALQDNLDIRGSWARLRQAIALARESDALLWPTLDASGSASRTRSETAGIVTRSDLFTATLAAAYELDLWNRVRSQADAASLDAMAARDDLETAHLSVAGTVGEVWYTLVEQRAQRRLLDEQIEASQTLLDLTELRFGQGLSSALDVYQQRQQLANTRSQAPLVDARVDVLRHQLAVLLGRPPLDEVAPEPAETPALPPLPDTGLPADLLERRPDVRAAAARLAAADHRVAAAVADRLPSVRLTGNAGYSSNESGALFDRPTWSIASNLLAPIFDAGRRAAEVSRTKAQVDEALAGYGQTVLTAFEEVEDALIQERKQQEYLAIVAERVGLAQATLRQARERYAHGLSDYLPVLTAIQSLQRVQREWLTANRDLILFRIRLYRALGGTWTRTLEPPEHLMGATE